MHDKPAVFDPITRLACWSIISPGTIVMESTIKESIRAKPQWDIREGMLQ